jgi:hypothetical protein
MANQNKEENITADTDLAMESVPASDKTIS